MEVPAEVAKIVIGSHGSAIKELQDRTGAHVMIYKPQPGARESGYRPVMIRGSRRSVDLATDELRRVVRDYEDGVVGGKDRRPPPSGDRGGYGGRGGFDDGYRGNDRGGRYDRYEDRGPPPGRGGGFDDRRGSFPPSLSRKTRRARSRTAGSSSARVARSSSASSKRRACASAAKATNLSS
jgi:hypothetical protein